MRWNSWRPPALGAAALCLCLGWPGAGSAQEKPKGPAKPGPRGRVVPLDLDRLPPDLAKQLLPYLASGPERREQPPKGPPPGRHEEGGPKAKPGAPEHPMPEAARELWQLLMQTPPGPGPAHGPRGPKEEPKHGPKPGPKGEHGPKGPGPGKGEVISITIQIPAHVADRLLDMLEGRLGKKPHEKHEKEPGPKGPGKPPKKPKPKKDAEP